MNNPKSIFSTAVALVIALLTPACSFNLIQPGDQIETGSPQVIEFQVPMPQEPSIAVALNLEFVAGDLTISPGADGVLASGTATFNADDFKPQIETAGSSTIMRAGEMKVGSFAKCPEGVNNVWDIQLADTPMSLEVEAGAYNGRFELGGLSLEKLAISDGGSDFTGSFSKPNRVAMSSFTYNTGASRTELKGLANANFDQMTFNAGPGDYTLNFDGDLQRDASVAIDSGLSTLNIIIPQGVNAQVIFDGGMTTINKEDGWVQDGNTYTLSGSGPTITITVKMGMGTLNLKVG